MISLELIKCMQQFLLCLWKWWLLLRVMYGETWLDYHFLLSWAFSSVWETRPDHQSFFVYKQLQQLGWNELDEDSSKTPSIQWVARTKFTQEMTLEGTQLSIYHKPTATIVLNGKELTFAIKSGMNQCCLHSPF